MRCSKKTHDALRPDSQPEMEKELFLFQRAACLLAKVVKDSRSSKVQGSGRPPFLISISLPET